MIVTPSEPPKAVDDEAKWKVTASLPLGTEVSVYEAIFGEEMLKEAVSFTEDEMNIMPVGLAEFFNGLEVEEQFLLKHLGVVVRNTHHEKSLKKL